jgi:7-keto-8-aminopelargonate synthetase-like enzyme
VNRARSFIFSTAPPPAQSAAARAGIELIQSPEGEQRRSTVCSLVDDVKAGIQSCGLAVPEGRSAIVPLIIGDETEAVQRSARLREAGFLVPAIRYPTVARGSARLRLTVTASHTDGDISALIKVLRTD